jgi:hypothetical protein
MVFVFSRRLSLLAKSVALSLKRGFSQYNEAVYLLYMLLAALREQVGRGYFQLFVLRLL